MEQVGFHFNCKYFRFIFFTICLGEHTNLIPTYLPIIDAYWTTISMNKLYTAGILFSAVLFISFSFNPPDGYTGAPGDQICANCHTQTNPAQNGVISLEGFPASITPGESYPLTLISRDTSGLAEKAGFQVTILSPINTRAGDLFSPSTSSTVSVFNSRQYWDHNPSVTYPDSNEVRWSVMWKAPELSAGSTITWYAAGNIANGNNQETGDRIVTASGSGQIVLASTDNPLENKPVVFPNPGADELNLVFRDVIHPDGEVVFYNMYGQQTGHALMHSGKVNTSAIIPGIYLLDIKMGAERHLIRWSKF